MSRKRRWIIVLLALGLLGIYVLLSGMMNAKVKTKEIKMAIPIYTQENTWNEFQRDAISSSTFSTCDNSTCDKNNTTAYRLEKLETGAKFSSNFSISDSNDSAVAKPDTQTTRNTLYVVVFGYPRTGSTFTGELFKQNPDSFYLFEPFITQQRTMNHPRPLDNSQYDEYIRQTWECYFTCDFTCLVRLIKINKDIVEKSNYFGVYRTCIISRKGEQVCIKKLEAICRNKSLRVFKTVRSTMEAAELMLSHKVISPDNLRLIHLTRDPRASFQSRLVVKAVTRGNTKYYNQGVCARMHRDIVLGQKLVKLYPKSFFNLHYEDLAHDPITVARSVYQFINQTNTPYVVEKWLKISTQSSNALEERWGTVRRNSSSTAEAWKSKLSETLKKEIDSVCHSFYNISEYYQPVSS